MEVDNVQKNDISSELVLFKDSLVNLIINWEKEVRVAVLATEESSSNLLPREITRSIKPKEKRLFPIGAKDFPLTQLPARDGIAQGTIKRSNRWPNDFFYTNWTSINDSITQDVNVLESGTFEVFIYYTCKAENVGTELELTFNASKINRKITETHEPPLIGEVKDRSPRMESYVKDFKPFKLGEFHLNKGEGILTLTQTQF